jgi:hypothetical protein
MIEKHALLLKGRRHILFVFFLLNLFYIKGLAQEDEVKFNLPAPDWKEGLTKANIGGWLYTDQPTENYRRTSSFKKNYPVSNLIDNNFLTAWAEGKDDDGIGEVVVIDIDTINVSKFALYIWGGYGKSEKTFSENNRPKKVSVYLLGTYCYQCTPAVCTESNWSVIDSLNYELKDLNGFQILPIPKIKIKEDSLNCSDRKSYLPDDPPIYNFKLAIKIVSIYKGTKYHDTCISEIGFHYRKDGQLKRAK